MARNSENIAGAISAVNGIVGAQTEALAQIKTTLARKAAGATDISLGITSAAVGDIVKVKAVDANGKPTEWEATGDGRGDVTWAETLLASGTMVADTTVDYDTGINLATLREYKSFVYRLKGASNVKLNNLYLTLGSSIANLLDRGSESGRIIVFEWADAAQTVLYMKSGYSGNSSMVKLDKNFAAAIYDTQGYELGQWNVIRYIDVSALPETTPLKFYCVNVPTIDYAFDIRGLTK